MKLLYCCRALLRRCCLSLLAASLAACASAPSAQNLYRALGGREGIDGIASRLIVRIGRDPAIRPYFEDSDLDRFHERFSQHLCDAVGGPCEYEGDTMVDIHTGMHITESDFNTVVDLLIAAMNDNGIPHRVQNRVLKELAPLRGDIIYR